MAILDPESMYIIKAAAKIAAGFCMGIGGIGPALGQGYIGGKACESLGKKPEHVNAIKSTMFLSMFIVETALVLVFITCLMILFQGSSSPQ